MNNFAQVANFNGKTPWIAPDNTALLPIGSCLKAQSVATNHEQLDSQRT